MTVFSEAHWAGRWYSLSAGVCGEHVSSPYGGGDVGEPMHSSDCTPTAWSSQLWVLFVTDATTNWYTLVLCQWKFQCWLYTHDLCSEI